MTSIPFSIVPNPNYTFTISTTDPVVLPIQIELDLWLPEEKKKVSAGCSCQKCGEFYPYAEPNQENGTLVCYPCRHGF